MPRYRSTSPFEQVLMGLSVGENGVAVFPADGRPDPIAGSTVVLGPGDEIETPAPVAFPGALEVDQPAPAPPPAPTPEPAPAPTPAEEPAP